MLPCGSEPQAAAIDNGVGWRTGQGGLKGGSVTVEPVWVFSVDCVMSLHSSLRMTGDEALEERAGRQKVAEMAAGVSGLVPDVPVSLAEDIRNSWA